MKIQLNADVGEGMLNDIELMPFLTYANIACGGHIGDENSVRRTIKLAQKYGVKIGAHPSYPDKDNFGRESIQMSFQDLEQAIIEQVDLFLNTAEVLKETMYHIKLHGALYNDVFKEKKTTDWLLNFISKKYKEVKVFVPIGAKNYVEERYQDIVIYEAFVDRNYNDQLQLVPRSEHNACIENPVDALKHVSGLFLENKLISISGNIFKLKADTFCLHGDHSNVLAIAKKISKLEKSV